MLSLTSAAEPIVMSLSVAFTQPTFQRVLPLVVGTILTMGRRTVTGILWTVRGLVQGHCSSYHRVFSRAVWSLWPLGKVLAEAILRWTDPHEPVLVASDDTTAQHKGAGSSHGKALTKLPPRLKGILLDCLSQAA